MLNGDSVSALADSLTLHYSECSNESYSLDLGDGVSLTLMLILAGEFWIGSDDTDADAEDSECPQRRVKLSHPFLMGATPVTQAQWRVVAGYEVEDIELKSEPSRFKGDELPMEQVSWEEATEFCMRLSKKTNKVFGLPSEAQWEYACCAETETAYHFGPQITDELANYQQRVGQTSEVKQYPPNRWGLYDTHGNVWEWCQDYWHDNYKGAPPDGSAWVDGENANRRVVRGGSWLFDPEGCRSASRHDVVPGDRSPFIGFRVSCAAPRTLV